MNPQKKLTKSQALAGMLAEQRAEELDMITSAMTPEQITAAIEEAGISREAQASYFARQDERIREAIARQPAPANVVPIRKDVVTAAPKKRTFSLNLTPRDVGFGATGVGITGTIALFVIRAVMAAAPVVAPLAASAPPDIAAQTREKAFSQCGQGHWQRCTVLLDEARDLDSAGDSDPAVVTARKLAEEGMREKR